MRKRNDASRMSGGELLYSPSGTLPRNPNRDFEQNLLYGSARAAVYLDGIASGRQPHRKLSAPVFFPAKHAPQAHSKAPPLRMPLVRVELKRMPSRVRFCLQRKARREALFAFGRAGFRGSAPKRSYRRTVNSNYGC